MSTRTFARRLALFVASLLAGTCIADAIMRIDDAPSRTPVKMARPVTP